MRAARLSAALLAAAQALAAVMGGRTAEAAIAAAGLEGPLRAAVQDLVFGTLRAYGRGDFFLDRLLAKPLAVPAMRGLLLAAIYRLELRPADAHTTVNEAVAAAGGIADGRYRRLANGVLRSWLRRRDELQAQLADDPVAAFQHPQWWLQRLQKAYPGVWPAIAAAGNSHPPMTLRVNRRRIDSDRYALQLADAGIEAGRLGDGALRLQRPLPVQDLPGFAEGQASIQDWGAQQAAPLLGAGDGMRVLDACAAPGGKTAHVLEAADVELTALDASAERARRIGENLDRLGLRADIVVGDAGAPASWWDGRRYDRILADVPCSASGVVRRHPDIKWLRRDEDVARFAATQAAIIDSLWPLLMPGGRMLYSTCSLFPEENAAQVAAFAARHPDARRLPTGADNDEWQLTPDADHDGFYYALLEKRR